MSFVFRKLEVCLGFPWMEISTESQVLVDRKWIDDLVRIHLVLRIPDGLEFLERLNEFRTEHLGQHLCLRLTVAVLSRNGTTVADYQIRGLADECSVIADAFNGAEVEVDAGMDAALSEVPVQRTAVSMLLE